MAGVALNRTAPKQHEHELDAEWKRRRGAASKAELRCALRRIEGRPSAGVTLVGGKGRVALHKSWAELAPAEKEAAEALGWWTQTWAEAGAPAVVGSRTDGAVARWQDLKPEQVGAARALGLNERAWELLAATDATEERRNRAEAVAAEDAVAEAAAALSESGSERSVGGTPGGSGGGGGYGSDDGSDAGNLSDIAEEDQDGSTFLVGQGEDADQGDGDDDKPIGRQAAVEQAAERLKAELRERRAANRALQQEASRPVVDPPWRGHSARAGWKVVRPKGAKAFPPGTKHSSGQGETAATGTAAENAGPPLTPRSDPNGCDDRTDVKGDGSLRRRRIAAAGAAAAGRKEQEQWQKDHRRNAAVWLERRSHAQGAPPSRPQRADPRASAGASRETPPQRAAAIVARQSPSTIAPPHCQQDGRAWVRSAVAALDM